jgi:predicted XRE-type DNA-binding protein
MEKFDNVWDALADTPQEVASLTARSDIMIALQEHIRASGRTQRQIAKELGVSQPRISDLMRGRIDLFSLDALFDLAFAAKLRIEIQIHLAEVA